MLTKVIDWIKNNKVASILAVFVILFLANNQVLTPYPLRSNMASFSVGQKNAAVSLEMDDMAMEEVSDSRGYVAPREVYQKESPQIDVVDRKVVTNSNMSLLVNNVRDTIKNIEQEVSDVKGYVVGRYINTPEGIERGHITVRLPADKLTEFMDKMRDYSVRVVYENISSNDVTDRYVDVEARLSTLEKNKMRFEQIMNEAKTVEEILQVQNRIFSLQDQIDNLKGQLQFMDSTSKTSLVSIDLSTDEIALPYTPDKPWKADVIFKKAVRSMISTYRSVGTAVIWIGVYAAIWLPIMLIILGVMWYTKKRKIESQ